MMFQQQQLQQGFQKQQQSQPQLGQLQQQQLSLSPQVLQGVPSFEDSLRELNKWIGLLDSFVWTGDGASSDRFRRVFEDKVYSTLSRALEHPRKNAGSRSKVESLNRKAVDVINVLRLADELDLDELHALSLWTCARNSKDLERDLNIKFGTTVFATAVGLFFYKRDLELRLLNGIARLRNSETDESKIAVIRAVSDDLLKDSQIISGLFSKIKHHNDRIFVLLSPQSRDMAGREIQIEALQQERRQLAEIIFLLVLGTHASQDEILGLVRLIQDVSNRLVGTQELQQSQSELNSSYETLYVLLFAMGAICDLSVKLYDRKTRDVCQVKFTEADLSFLHTLKELVDIPSSPQAKWSPEMAMVTTSASALESASDNWKHDGVHGVAALFFATLMASLGNDEVSHSRFGTKEERNRLYNGAFTLRGLAFLRGVLRSPEFCEDSLRTSYVEVLSVICGQSVAVAMESLNDRDLSEEELLIVRSREIFLENARSHQKQRYSNSLGLEESPLPDSMEDLLFLMQSIHQLDGVVPFLLQEGPENEIYADENLRQFLHIALQEARRDNDPHSLYVAVLCFLSALPNGRESEERDLLKLLGAGRQNSSGDIRSDLRLNTLFGALQFFERQLLPGGEIAEMVEKAPRTIPLGDQLVLAAWMRLFNSCLNHQACFKLAFTEPNSLDMFLRVSLALVNLELEPCLKAQFVTFVGNVVKHFDSGIEWWSRIGELAGVALGSSAMVGRSLVHQQGPGFPFPSASSTVSYPSALEQLLEDVRSCWHGTTRTPTSSWAEVFPYTIAFLDLMWDFLENGKNADSMIFLRSSGQGKIQQPSQTQPFSSQTMGVSTSLLTNNRFVQGSNNSGPSVLTTDMEPFLEFVLNDVFLSLDQRSFVNAGEKWKVVVACMRIFNAILDGYTMGSRAACSDFGWPSQAKSSSFYSTGFWVMTKVLEGGAFFKQLVNLLQEIGGESGVRRRRQQGGTRDSRQFKAEDDIERTPSMLLHRQIQGISASSLRHQGLDEIWFMVSSKASNLDVRNSSIVQGESALTEQGYGMLRTRKRNMPLSLTSFDGGRLGSWLATPEISGWSQVVPPKIARDVTHQKPGRGGEVHDFGWDDGDPCGAWREHVARLILRFLCSVSNREDWFFEAVHKNEVAFEHRLERLHRLFVHDKERLFAIAEFFKYPFSVEIRLNAVELINMLAQQAPSGSIVSALRSKMEILASALAVAVEQNINDVAGLTLNPSNAHSFSDGDRQLGEYNNGDLASQRILLALISGLSQPRGNITELLLGLFDIATGSARPDSINLSVHKPCLLNYILDALDNDHHSWHKNPKTREMAYHLLFLLCDNRFTGFSMSYGLNKERKRFWLRHLHMLMNMNAEQRSGYDFQSLAWIIGGIAGDLRAAASGNVPEVSLQEVLPRLISVEAFTTVAAEPRVNRDILDVVDKTEMTALFSEELIKDEPGIKLKVAETFCGQTLFYAVAANSSSAVKRWNDEVFLLSAKARAIAEWTALVKVVIVDCAEELNRFDVRGSFLEVVAESILEKLRKEMTAHPVLIEPLASILVSLMFRLALEGEAQLTPQEEAMTAATGSYSLAFAAVKNPLKSSSASWLEPSTAVRSDKFDKFLEFMLDSIVMRPKATSEMAFQGSSLRFRGYLYISVSSLIKRARRRFAEALAGLGSHCPVEVTEANFLSETKHLSDDSSIRELRGRASSILEILSRNDLLEFVEADAMGSSDPFGRVSGKLMLKILLECDVEMKWMAELWRRGQFREMLSSVAQTINNDTLEIGAPIIYELHLAILSSVACSVKGAEMIAESGFLESISLKPLTVLCDKRALDAWYMLETQQQAEHTGARNVELQERRHDLVLPLLRMLCATFTTLKSSGDSSVSALHHLQDEAIEFCKVQRRMFVSSLGFPPFSLDDIDESCLLLSFLTHATFARVKRRVEEVSAAFGAAGTEFDTLAYDLMRELCVPQRGMWTDIVQPGTKIEQQRHNTKTMAPPDVLVDSENDFTSPTLSIFQLDVLSQQRRLLQATVTYCRSRRSVLMPALVDETASGVIESSIHALILCLDFSAHNLAAVARSSGSMFQTALAQRTYRPRPGATGIELHNLQWERHPRYVHWACSSLLFVAEGCLAVLLEKLKALRRSKASANLDKWIGHRKLLAHHFNPASEKSAIEQLEDVIKANSSSSQFIHLCLRRIRDLQ